jgi:hypothetical protein
MHDPLARRSEAVRSWVYAPLVDETSLLLFADETYLPSSEGEVLRVATWAIPQADLREDRESLRQVLRSPRQQRIPRVLDWLSRHRCIGLISDTIQPAGRKHIEYADLHVLPQSNVIWSYAVGFTLAKLVALASKRWPLSTISLYFDPKSLAPQHMAGFRDGFKRRLSELQHLRLQEDYPGLDFPVSVTEIQEVPKATAPTGSPPAAPVGLRPLLEHNSELQLGTLVAHWLTKAPGKRIGLPTCIHRCELSEVIDKLRERADDPAVHR